MDTSGRPFEDEELLALLPSIVLDVYDSTNKSRYLIWKQKKKDKMGFFRKKQIWFGINTNICGTKGKMWTPHLTINSHLMKDDH